MYTVINSMSIALNKFYIIFESPCAADNYRQRDFELNAKI